MVTVTDILDHQLSVKERYDLLVLEALIEAGELTAEEQDKLGSAFPPELVGYKPQPWCRACSQNKQVYHCDNHKLIRCPKCQQKVTEAHIDLDFVGHAAVTQRLLQVDPTWKWLPVDWHVFSLPDPGKDGMWICLIVRGVARLGIGETEGGRLEGANAIKARVSDAIKNASMRFGVALDSWSKQELHDTGAPGSVPEEARQQAEPPGRPSTAEWAQKIGAAKDVADFSRIHEEAKKAGAHDGVYLAAARTRKRQLDTARADQPAANSAK